MGRGTEPPDNDPAEEEEEEGDEGSGFHVKTAVLGDTATMKRLLDDHVADVLQGEMGYEMDVSLSNVKLVIGFSAVAAALYSHVHPAPFPNNWWVLVACCAYYFAMSGVLQFLLSYVELEAYLQLRPKMPGSFGINIASSFPRFSDRYTLALTPLPGGSLQMHRAPKFNPKTAAMDGIHTLDVSVTEFFDEDGVFHQSIFGERVKAFMNEYETKQAGDVAKKEQ